MKLAALGVVTVAIGLVLSIPGLIGIGAFWVPTGLAVRAHGQRLKRAQEEHEAGTSAGTPTGTAGGQAKVPAIDGRTFTVGTLLLLGVGVPSLVVGLWQVGIDAVDAEWRWLPIVVGGLSTGVAVVSGLLYAAGAGVTAAAETISAGDVPATIWIRSVSETGTFVNERPRLAFELRVEPDAGTGVAPYEVRKKATVPFTAMGSLRVGDGFKALVVGPERPEAMDIDWDAPVTSDGDPADVSDRLEELEQLRRESRITEEEYQAQRQRILGSL